MRIARVLTADSPTPIVALERDGALYSLAELDRRRATAFSPERFGGSSDFHTRVVSLGCAGIAELDDELRAGKRPTSARIAPGTFTWLPPCDIDRVIYVQTGPYPLEAPPVEPRYRIGNARGLLGHDAAVPFPEGEEEPGFELGIAAVLRDDLKRATAAEAERAILGYALLVDWKARARERREGPSSAGACATQLGPVLVSKDEVGDVAALRVEARIREVDAAAASDDRASVRARAGDWAFAIAESVAFVSASLDLHAGDVIGAGAVICAEGVRYGWRVDCTADRLGKLAGRPVRGPAPPSWRR